MYQAKRELFKIVINTGQRIGVKRSLKEERDVRRLRWSLGQAVMPVRMEH